MNVCQLWHSNQELHFIATLLSRYDVLMSINVKKFPARLVMILIIDSQIRPQVGRIEKGSIIPARDNDPLSVSVIHLRRWLYYRGTTSLDIYAGNRVTSGTDYVRV